MREASVALGTCSRVAPRTSASPDIRRCAGACRGVQLDSRQPSSTEVPMRLIGLAVILTVGLILEPLAAEAQTAKKVWRIGYLVLSPLVDPPTAERQAFLGGLRELGYVEGQNIVIEYRSANWNRELLPDLAQELGELKVDVIMAVPGTTDAARHATRTIPIVIAGGTDPVASRLVPSLARPGANITGMMFAPAEMAGKRMQLLKETFPKLARLAVLWSPENDRAH